MPILFVFVLLLLLKIHFSAYQHQQQQLHCANSSLFRFLCDGAAFAAFLRQTLHCITICPLNTRHCLRGKNRVAQRSVYLALSVDFELHL